MNEIRAKKNGDEGVSSFTNTHKHCCVFGTIHFSHPLQIDRLDGWLFVHFVSLNGIGNHDEKESESFGKL